MIIRDKQDLRKCVKQSVRRAPVTETAVRLSVLHGGYGVGNWLNQYAKGSDDPSLQARFDAEEFGSPFSSSRCELLAALDAMNLPTHDLNKAETIISGHDNVSYLSMVLNALRANRLLIETDGEEDLSACYADERLKPLLLVQKDAFVPGRYGIDFAQYARQLEETALRLSARDIRLDRFDADILSYCIIPVCEDAGLVLLAHPDVKCLVSTDASIESCVLSEIQVSRSVLLRIGNMANLPAALEKLGVWFVPFSSQAKTPEELLGKWIRAKESIWQHLADAYLPLARTGYELTREQIETDAELLLGGNLEVFYK